MKISCVVCIWIFLTETRFSSTYCIKAHGYSGKNITASCHHSWASTNNKYFCRDPCAHKDVLVSSDRSPNGRFSLKDFRNGTFTVTITDLQETDSGIYWCGVDRVGVDTFREVNLKVSKDITPTTTRLDTTQPLPTLTRQPECLFATSSRTSRSSTLEHTTQVPSVTGLVNISLYAVGGLIAVVILVCGLVAVHHYRKLVKKMEGLGSVTPVDHIEGTAEEATNVYENDLQDTPNSKQMKSEQLKSKVQRRQSPSVYENVELKPGQLDVILGNL